MPRFSPLFESVMLQPQALRLPHPIIVRRRKTRVNDEE
jgi:hypothetical protein